MALCYNCNMNFANYIEYIGYLASALVLISLMMKSLIRLRILNLFGALCFAIYGFIIGAIPVILLNVALVLVNAYHLFRKRAKEKNHIQLIPIASESITNLDFFQMNTHDIQNFFGDVDIKQCKEIYLIIKNDSIAGIFAGSHNNDVFDLSLDFVSAVFRDYKIGQMLYKDNTNILLSKNIHTIQAHTNHPEHMQYLLRMGFSQTSSNAVSNNSNDKKSLFTLTIT